MCCSKAVYTCHNGIIGWIECQSKIYVIIIVYSMTDKMSHCHSHCYQVCHSVTVVQCSRKQSMAQNVSPTRTFVSRTLDTFANLFPVR